MSLLARLIRERAEADRLARLALRERVRRALYDEPPRTLPDLVRLLSASTDEVSRAVGDLIDLREVERDGAFVRASATMTPPVRSRTPLPSLPVADLRPVSRTVTAPPPAPPDPAPLSPPVAKGTQQSNADNRPTERRARLSPGGKRHSTERRRQRHEPPLPRVSPPVRGSTPTAEDLLIWPAANRKRSPSQVGSLPLRGDGPERTLNPADPAPPISLDRPNPLTRTSSLKDGDWKRQQRQFFAITSYLANGWRRRIDLLNHVGMKPDTLDERLRWLENNGYASRLRKGVWGPGRYRFVLPAGCADTDEGEP